jgi:hypothetical protein
MRPANFPEARDQRRRRAVDRLKSYKPPAFHDEELKKAKEKIRLDTIAKTEAKLITGGRNVRTKKLISATGKRKKSS